MSVKPRLIFSWGLPLFYGASLALYVLSLFLNFMCQNQDFSTYKKECTLLFLHFYQSLSISWNSFTPCFGDKPLSINFDTFKIYWLCKMLFPHCPQDVALKFRYPVCVSFFTELDKMFSSWIQIQFQNNTY